MGEATIIDKARQFDPETLAEIYDQHSPGIYRYAMRLLGDIDLAEECVSETFSRYLAGLRNGGGPQEYLKAYLYRIAHNWITDYFRRSPPPSLPLEPDMIIGDEHQPHQIVTSQMEQERVRKALAMLTPEQRQVIMLKYLEEFSNNEIAKALDKPVGAVKSLQHRALASLRRILLYDERPQ